MNKLLKFLTLAVTLIIVLSFSVIHAQTVSETEAFTYAGHYLEKHSGYSVDQVVHTHCAGDEATFFVFQLQPRGFIIISADRSYFPVLGFSNEGDFPIFTENNNYFRFLEHYSDQITHLRNNPSIADKKIEEAWAYPTATIGNRRATVEPMTTSMWNQDSPYNYLCPYDPSGNGGHVYAGCVATAMTMIMHYWQWPFTGDGSVSYYCSGYGSLSVNCSEGDYNPYGMINSADSKFCKPIAELMYHCGVTNHMGYGPDLSGTGSTRVATSFRNNFRYDDDCSLVYRDMLGNQVFIDTLIHEMVAGRPVWFAGVGATGGHAFVVDGCNDNDMIHINFGWSGQGNGYYTVFHAGGYNAGQQAVIGIQPDYELGYPYYCNGIDTLTFLQGSVFDGSGPMANYQDQALAQWLIAPQLAGDSVTEIEINWIEIDLDQDDYVRIYDGPTTESSLLGEYTGNTLPASLVSSGNTLLVKFESNEAGNATGFKLEYFAETVEFCNGMTQLTTEDGVVSDGSELYKYGNGSICMWQVVPESQEPLLLSFNQLQTEANFDFLKIVDMSNNEVLGDFSGIFDPEELPEDIYVESGKVMLMFLSNGYVNEAGWEISYTTTITRTENEKINSATSDFNVYPNPATDIIYISPVSPGDKTVQVMLFDMQGRLVKSRNIDAQKAQLSVADLPRGMYLLRIISNEFTQQKKIFIHKN